MTQQRRFTKEFEEEAVRLVQTSGRTQREIAEDLGIGLSTLVRWMILSGSTRSAFSHGLLDFCIARPSRPSGLGIIRQVFTTRCSCY
jgi:Helix-turn-helix domain of transposase family ISL3